MDIGHDAEIIRAMIRHENTLIIERTNWMLAGDPQAGRLIIGMAEAPEFQTIPPKVKTPFSYPPNLKFGPNESRVYETRLLFPKRFSFISERRVWR